MGKYQKLDEAIREHLRSGCVHPMYAKKPLREARTAPGLASDNDSEKAWRLVDRRLQAMKKAGEVTYERTKGGGHGRWLVVEAPVQALQAAAPGPATAQAPGPEPVLAGASSTTPVMVYAARYPDMPGYGAITVDEPERAKAVAKDIAAWVRSGAVVERVTLDVGRAGLGETCRA